MHEKIEQQDQTLANAQQNQNTTVQAQASPYKAKQTPVQRKSKPPIQAKQSVHEAKQQPVQRQANNTGLPDNLKSGIENLSGYSMDDVKVHYNSDKPAQLKAHAYAQGTDIHLGAGQEQHLPHEAWHVVQQKQNRVTPTLQMKGGAQVNDSPALEQEADVMGAKALQMKCSPCEVKQATPEGNQTQLKTAQLKSNTIQRFTKWDDSGKTYRVSDDSTAAVVEGYPNHELYAKAGKAKASNKKLQSVGSGIELEEESTTKQVPKGSGTETLKKVVPINKTQSGKNKGEDMEIWADCGKSSGVVVGSTNRTALYRRSYYKFFGSRVQSTSASSPGLMKAEIIKHLLETTAHHQLLAGVDKSSITNTLSEAKVIKTAMDKALKDKKWDVYRAERKKYAAKLMSFYIGLKADVKDNIDKTLEINKYANPDVGQGYTMSSGGANYAGTSTWNFHWGGVVMKSDDGKDNITLENYAVGDASVKNKDWDFAMYGTVKNGQTFHDEHHDTHQHGKDPTTMVVKKK